LAQVAQQVQVQVAPRIALLQVDAQSAFLHQVEPRVAQRALREQVGNRVAEVEALLFGVACVGQLRDITFAQGHDHIRQAQHGAPQDGEAHIAQDGALARRRLHCLRTPVEVGMLQPAGGGGAGFGIDARLVAFDARALQVQALQQAVLGEGRGEFGAPVQQRPVSFARVQQQFRTLRLDALAG
jgi:hypothetical protein